MAAALDRNLSHFADVAAESLGRDLRDAPGAGAAGGMGGGCAAFLGAELKSGIEAILDLVDFDACLEGADLVYTPKTGDGAEKFPCPCCGYKTFPVPKEEAAAYICPVCFWENDVFSPGEDQPSDENRGITLNQGREALRKLGAVRKELARYVRKPLPEEIP